MEKAKDYLTIVSPAGNFYPNDDCNYLSSMVFYPVESFENEGANFNDDFGNLTFVYLGGPTAHLNEKDGDYFKVVSYEDIPHA